MAQTSRALASAHPAEQAKHSESRKALKAADEHRQAAARLRHAEKAYRGAHQALLAAQADAKNAEAARMAEMLAEAATA